MLPVAVREAVNLFVRYNVCVFAISPDACGRYLQAFSAETNFCQLI